MDKQTKIERAVKVLADEIGTLDDETKTVLQVFLGVWVKFPASERTNAAVLSCFVPPVVQSAEVLPFRPRCVSGTTDKGRQQ